MVEPLFFRLFPKNALGTRFAIFTAKVFSVFFIGLLVVFAAFLTWIHSTYLDIAATGAIEGRLDRMEQAMVNQESGERGFQLTGNSDFLKPFLEGSTQFQQLSVQVRQQIEAENDNPELLQAVNQMIETGTLWHAKYGLQEVEALQAGRSISRTDMRASKETFDEFRQAAVIAHQAAANERQSSQRKMVTLLSTVAAGTCLAAGCFAFLILTLIIRRLRQLVQPIEELNVAVAAYAEQNFSVPVPAMVEGEIGNLLRSVDVMRQKLQSFIQASEEKYRLIAEHTTDLIRVVDVNGVVQYASPSHQLVLGYSPEEIEGRVFLDFVQVEDRELLTRSFRRLLEQKKPYQMEFRVQQRGGMIVTLETKSTPVLDERGQVVNVIAVCRDVTERKKTEDMLRKSDKLSVVGELAAGIGHEIRNPLTAIRGFVQLLGTAQENQWYAEVILSEVDRINQIISEFMLLAKPQQQSYSWENPCHIVDMVMTLLNSQALLYNVRFLAEFDAHVPLIHCEVNQLKQVFINLIKNAIEAMATGGDLLIQVRAVQPDSVVIRFIDSGCGIPEELIHRLGEPFYTTKEKGTGLGLMMCFKIMEAHRGTMQIESVHNVGTTIELTFPVYADAAVGNPLNKQAKQA